ncbi:MAG: response regulator [Oligoflexales bacterium]
MIEERKVRVICTDLLMPGTDGQDIIDACKNFSWNTDIIVMTGIANIERAFKCFDSGAWEVLLKPVDLSRICAALNRVVDRYQLWHATCDRLGIE